MRNFFLFVALVTGYSCFAQNFTTYFEKSKGLESAPYPEIIRWWKKLATTSPIVQLKTIGTTDSGLPLHLVLLSTDKTFSIQKIKTQHKAIILINNGIHPGEPDGIDASMLLARDIVQKKYALPSSIVVAIIPVYNIGGALNRSKNFRIDQNGPLEKGFRGNAQNLDLNRDFIKMDSKNAFAFATIFHTLDPDVFIDNHVSNGADYQHVITLLTSQYNKLGGAMGEFLNTVFEPSLYPLMKQKGYDLVPYVNHADETPDKGWPQFWDSPRYSSGYATLWSTFSFVPETHMLKPFKQRVEATKAMMESLIEATSQHKNDIIDLRRKTRQEQLTQQSFPITWKLDKNKAKEILFKGYTPGYKTSMVSGLRRLYYDRTKPIEKMVPFYDRYIDSVVIKKPLAYIIPQGWWKIIDRLKANGIVHRPLKKDTIINVETYHIENYSSTARPYEGHHPNREVKISSSIRKVSFRAGDYYIPLQQKGNRFLVETLEPQGEDSYFVWNFFDAILGQKEGFSDYVFEETAAEFLSTHPEIKKKLEEKKASDSAFAKNGYAQLDFVYRNSPYYESAYLQYPIYRVLQ